MTRATVTRGDFIPIGATRVVRAGVKAEAFTYTNPQRHPAAMGFSGRRQRPGFHQCYASHQRRSRMLEAWFDEMAKDEERRAARNRPHDLKMGDILVASWGYNQTNVDFYEVRGVIGRNTVELMQIEYRVDHGHPGSGGAMCDHVLPCPGAGMSGRFRARVNMTCGAPRVKINSVAYAWRWNGQPEFRSWWS